MPQNVLKDVIPKVLGHIGVSDKNFAIISILERELTYLASHARIAGVKNNKIYVEMASSAHLQEASLRKKELLKSVASFFPKGSGEAPEIKFFLKGTERSGGKFTRVMTNAGVATDAREMKVPKKSFGKFYKSNFTENEKTD